jgi:hypothetical protein
MATTLNAVLNIAAKTSGEAAISGLTKTIGALETKSKSITSGLQRIAGSAGGVGGALGMLAPALSVGGLVGLANNSIKGGDALNDLSQKTGVSVEALSRFKKAASVSGTDLEGVSKSLVKLSKGMYETATTGKGPAAEAFKTLGISATDASGKLKSSDKVMLEVANRFKSMPDGAEKTALALQLFGKAGADMIPMLNMGGDAIEKMSTKMTAAFAKKADDYSDKLAILQGKIGGIGTSIAIALLPALDKLATILTTVVDFFTKLPEPVQAIAGGFTLLAIAVVALAPFIGPIVAGFQLLAGISLGATIAGWLGALTPFVAWIGGAIAAIVGWPLLIGVALVAIGALLYTFRDQIGAFLAGIAKAFIDGLGTLGGIAATAWQAVSKGFITYVSTPISKAWSSLVTFLGTALANVTGGITKLWTGMVDGVKGALRGMVQFAANALNGVIGAIRVVIQGINNARAAVRMGPIEMPGFVTVPKFAEGAVVNSPTLAMVGEGGEREYIIPASKMGNASANYLAGSRGASVLNGGSAGGGSAMPQINITTGPVMQTPDGQQWVTIGDLERAQRQTVSAVLGQLRTPAGRYAVGVR